MCFDSKAKDWDKDQKKVARAALFAKEIGEFLQPDKSQHALEFGCGTGLLSFELRDVFKSITLVDNSAGMMKVLKQKIAQSGVSNFTPLQADLFEDINKFPEVDVVYTLMTLHHMFDLDKTIGAFASITRQGGYLCIADLVEEDGSFHDDPDDEYGFKGFAKEQLSAVLKKFGIETVYYSECDVIEKEVEGELKQYPLFLMIGKKVG